MRAMRLMRAVNQRALCVIARRETGAMAVLMALVITVVLVPLTALAVDNFTRTGVQSELQRAADAGALAGAARIQLGDPSKSPQLVKDIANASTDATPLLSDLTAGCGATSSCPDVIAKAVCEQVLSQGDNFGSKYADTAPACTATLDTDTGAMQDAISCAQALTSINVGPLLPGVLSGITTLDQLLPALITPRVIVTAQWQTHDPFNAYSNGGSDPTHSRTATARRVFKSIFPLVGLSANLNEGLSDFITSQLSAVTALVNGALTNPLTGLNSSSCTNVVGDIGSDANDVVDPTDQGGQTVQQALTDAGTSPVLVLQDVSPVGGVVPECVSLSGGTVVLTKAGTTGACLLSAPGVFKARLVDR
jgi:hypothetical protein